MGWAVSCPAPEPVLGIAAPQGRETPPGRLGGWHDKSACGKACKGALPGVEVRRPFRLGDGAP